ncbi:MAG: hypothetical protein M3041_15430 [Acidobacteriota bacterium]|nr:hypothetical protein [Acidobacteriota bacterium]
MKRLALILGFAITVPGFALTQSPRPGDRIGVLRMPDRYAHGAEQAVAKTVQTALRSELRDLGFDAYDARLTYDELSRHSLPAAEYFVEIISGPSANHPVGGAGIGAGAVSVEVGVVVAQVAAEVRVYDGRTLNPIAQFDLHKNKTAVLPMGIGLGGRWTWAYIALPFMQYGQYRAAAHEVAHQAAERIAGR